MNIPDRSLAKTTFRSQVLIHYSVVQNIIQAYVVITWLIMPTKRGQNDHIPLPPCFILIMNHSFELICYGTLVIFPLSKVRKWAIVIFLLSPLCFCVLINESQHLCISQEEWGFSSEHELSLIYLEWVVRHSILYMVTHGLRPRDDPTCILM